MKNALYVVIITLAFHVIAGVFDRDKTDILIMIGTFLMVTVVNIYDKVSDKN